MGTKLYFSTAYHP
jgi:hypothetical protein